MYLTKAEVKAGDEEILFPIRLPVSSSNPGGVDKFRAVPVHLTSRTDVAVSRYSMEMSLFFEEDADVFKYTTFGPMFPVDTSVDKVGDKFQAFNESLQKRYPFLARVPKIELVQPDPATGTKLHFRVTMPPFTSLLSSDPHLFAILRFPPGQVKTLRDEEGKNGYGFYNAGENVQVCDAANFNREAELHEESKIIRGGIGPTQASVRNYPMEVTFFGAKDWLPLTLDEPLPMDLMGATKGLSELTEQGLQLLNFNTSFLEVRPTAINQLVVKSLILPSTEEAVNCLVEVRLSVELASFLQLKDPLLQFPTNDGMDYLMEVSNLSQEDPMKKLYPLTLECLNHGQGEHYLEGRGKISLLGCALSNGHFVGEGVELKGEVNQLRLLIFDRHQEPFKCQHDISHFLTLELTPF